MKKLWNYKEYKFNPPILMTDQVLERHINLFWKNVMNKTSIDQHILLLLKVKFIDNQIRTLNDLQTINVNSKSDILDYFKGRVQVLDEAYKVIPISSLIFSYGIRKGKVSPTVGIDLNKDSKNKNTKFQVYYRNELPIAMLPEDYGTILSKVGNNYTILVNRGMQNAIINLSVKTLGGETVNHVKYIKNNILLFSWTDTITSFNDKKLTRRIGKSINHYIDGEITLYTTIKKN